MAHGTANAKKVMDDIKAGGKFSECHFIEFMACPGGCLGGGGQPIPTNADIRAARAKAIYSEDTAYSVRKSHENPAVARDLRASSSPTVRAGTRATSCCTPPTRRAASTSRRSNRRTAAATAGRSTSAPPSASLSTLEDNRLTPSEVHGQARQPDAAVDRPFVDPFRDARALTPITPEERKILRTVNQKIAARPSLRAIVDYLFDNTQELIPCDRIGLAFVDERGERVTSYYNRASYAPLRHRQGLLGGAAADVAARGAATPGSRASSATSTLYLEAHPRSRSTKRLVQEGVRSNLTCPLSVEGRVVGFIFRSSRRTHTYRPRHIELQMAITERLSQAVEKAWRIEQLEEANYAYTQMLGFVSHELKSPVASMVTDAQLLDAGLSRRPHRRPDSASSPASTRKGQYLLSLVRRVPRPGARRGRRAPARSAARAST